MRIQDMRRLVERSVKKMDAKDLDLLKKDVEKRRATAKATDIPLIQRGEHLAEGGRRPSRSEFERILGNNDLVDLNYMTRGLQAARSVCRIILREPSGRHIGFGTGFKVSPRLILTNHHVFPDSDTAGTALAEFDYELDVKGVQRKSAQFKLRPDLFFENDEDLDLALVPVSPVSVDGTAKLEDYGFLRLNPQLKKVVEGEFITLIQHPSGLPKQVALRENLLLKIADKVLWYTSDTAQGSSGAPVMNDSWQIIGLHHSGVPKRDQNGKWLLKSGQPADDNADDADIDWIANEGIRASLIVDFVKNKGGGNEFVTEFLRASNTDLAVEDTESMGPGELGSPATSSSASGTRIEMRQGGARVTVPLTFNVSFEDAERPKALVKDVAPMPDGGIVAVEKAVMPFFDPDYTNRTGYDEAFLGNTLPVPLPVVTDKNIVAKMEDGEHVIPYVHFSVVMDKERRLCLLTAANVDHRKEMQEPEPNRDYSRKGLGGFGPKDTELWISDPRVFGAHQLPDRFFSKDKGAFDRGHVVRREDVCWGKTYDEVRRANGDTYHTTNCTPQVAGFNQSSKHGIWGELEEFIKDQAQTEAYCLFAGPVLDEKDRRFAGVDMDGAVKIQIPSAYWKVVVARKGNRLETFAFVLEQDLANVPLEFQVTTKWEEKMISIPDLQNLVGNLKFDKVLHDTDQFGTAVGNDLLDKKKIPARGGKKTPPAKKAAKKKVAKKKAKKKKAAKKS